MLWKLKICLREHSFINSLRQQTHQRKETHDITLETGQWKPENGKSKRKTEKKLDIPLFFLENLPARQSYVQISLAYGVPTQSRDSSRRRFLIWFKKKIKIWDGKNIEKQQIIYNW